MRVSYDDGKGQNTSAKRTACIVIEALTRRYNAWMTCSPLLYTRPGVFLRSSHGTDKRQPWKLLLFRNRSSIGVDRQKRAMATHVSFGKRLEIHFVGHVLRLASTLRVDKKERRARFLISPSSSLLQEVCSPQLTTAGSKRKKIRRRRRRHVRSISMQGRITDTKKQSRRERERERPFVDSIETT